MKVLLINIDSKLPNLALKKIEKYHLDKGDEIIWDMDLYCSWADKIYVSCIFTKNRGLARYYEDYRAEIGGTGYDLRKTLPPEIESVKARINYGYTTRGCIRKCPWCVVPVSEGKLRVVGDIYDIWDGKNKWVVLFDNNILADPNHFDLICSQLIKEDLVVDFNQGLDIRLITPAICKQLEKLRFKKEVRFSFDQPAMENVVRRKVLLLRRYHIPKFYFFYVLVGFNTTFEEDMHRLKLLKEWGCRPYVMRHTNTPKEKRYIRLAQWVNMFWTFQKYGFKEFCKIKEGG